MAKQKKKRNKVYKGSDAATTQPSVTRIAAVRRNKPQQWWFDHKRIVKPVSITSGVAIIVVWLLFELIRVLF
jgi:hypothetical protein